MWKFLKFGNLEIPIDGEKTNESINESRERERGASGGDGVAGSEARTRLRANVVQATDHIAAGRKS